MVRRECGGEEAKRLRPKYSVFRMTKDGKVDPTAVCMISTDPNNVDSPFVLMPRRDPAAFNAMVTYANYCEPVLASRIKGWLTKIARAEPVYGTQGIRNREHMRMMMLGGLH